MKELTEHKELMRHYEVCASVEEAPKEHIEKAVDSDWLAEIDDEILWFANVISLKMITHLHDCGRNLDFVDTKELLAECNGPWDITEHPQSIFQLSWLGLQATQSCWNNIWW